MTSTQADSGWARLFGKAFSRSQTPMLLSDDERRIVDVNAAFARVLGMRRGQLAGLHTYDLVVDGPLMAREEWRRTIARDQVTGEADLKRADGTTVRVHFAVHPETVTGRRLVLFVAMSVPRWGRQSRRTHGQSDGTALSAREQQVIDLVALGGTSQEIAGRLQISEHTVRKHVDTAMRKVGARSRAHLVAKTLGEGVVGRGSGTGGAT